FLPFLFDPLCHFTHYILPSQPRLKIPISECFYDFTRPVLSLENDIREPHPVECIRLHHFIDRHVLKLQTVSTFQRLCEGIIPDHVPRKACGPCQPVHIRPLVSRCSAVRSAAAHRTAARR